MCVIGSIAGVYLVLWVVMLRSGCVVVVEQRDSAPGGIAHMHGHGDCVVVFVGEKM